MSTYGEMLERGIPVVMQKCVVCKHKKHPLGFKDPKSRICLLCFAEAHEYRRRFISFVENDSQCFKKYWGNTTIPAKWSAVFVFKQHFSNGVRRRTKRRDISSSRRSGEVTD